MAKNWIAGAIKHPGALHKQLGVPQGEKIPAKKLAKAAQAGGKLGQRARLAETLKGMKGPMKHGHEMGDSAMYDRHLGNPAHGDHTPGHVGGHGEVDGHDGHRGHDGVGGMKHMSVPNLGAQSKKHIGKHGGKIGSHPYGGSNSGNHTFANIMHRGHKEKMEEG